MKFKDINTMMGEIAASVGCDYAYHHFEEAKQPPYMVFYIPSEDKYVADSINYASVKNLTIELYTDNKEPLLEAKIETILTEHELPFDKSEVYINDEHMYEQIYELEVIS